MAKITHKEVMRMSWMSKNSKEHYGFPNHDEIHELAGRIAACIVLVLLVAFMILMAQ